MNIFDHCKAVEDIMAAGIDCYMSKGTAEQLKLNSHRVNTMENKKQYNLGMWTCLAFDVEHDAAEPLGFYIASKSTKETVLYITDTFYSRYNFRHHRLDYLMVEANYSEDILNDNIESGRVPAAQKNRIIKSHMSLKTVKDMLKANDLSQVKEIWLLHLSDRNSNAERFKREIQEISGKPVYVAG